MASVAQYPILGYGLFEKLRVHVVLALVQVGYSVFQLLTKIAFEQGLNKTVYPVYRNVIGFAFLLPLAAYYERKERPKLTFSHITHFFFLGFTAVSLGQGLYLYGLYNTSPTFASAFQNSIPAVTFVLAAISGVEDVNLWKADGQAKLFGAVSAGVGATIMTIYKGPLIIEMKTQRHNLSYNGEQFVSLVGFPTWRLGSLYLLVSCLAFGVFYNLQARTLKLYPARYSTVCFTNMFGALQLAGFALVSQPDISSIWKIKPGIQLISVLYAGLVASGIVFAAQAWCMQQAGPVIVSAYQPLQTVVVGIISFLFLRESFYLGSLIGAVLIIGGLYLVTWGQEKQQQSHLSSSAVSQPDKREENQRAGEHEDLLRPLLDSGV